MSTKPTSIDKKAFPTPICLTPIIHRSVVYYVLSIGVVTAICFLFGWSTLKDIASGLIYGALGLALFGALTFAGNKVPAQLSRLSLPKYSPPKTKHDQDAERIESSTRNEAIGFFIATILSAALLFVTGVLLK